MTTFLSSILFTYFILGNILRSNPKSLPFLHVKAGKSQSHTFLLGGLGLSGSALLSIIGLLLFSRKIISSEEVVILTLSIFSIITVTFYGFLDDKFELRARHKLFLQVITVAIFITPLAHYIYAGNYLFVFVSFIIGLAFINGCNLIDGLDTIFAKIGIVTSLAFFALSIYLESYSSMFISALTLGSLMTFYYFNKEPAKIYAGEIGGSLLGILFYIQGNLLFYKVSPQGFNQSLNILSQVLMVSIYPLSELGITFSRRLFFRQSPFRGDHLHIHHIIKNKFSLSPSQTANVLAITITATISLGASITQFSNSVAGFLAEFMILSTIYCSISLKYWKKAYSKNKTNILFSNLNEGMIQVIDSKSIESFYSTYCPMPNLIDEDIAA